MAPFRKLWWMVVLAGTFTGTAAFPQTTALLLFGGSNHKTFLGCLNCDRNDANSICNKFGSYGSKYASESIWNAYGTFGSKYSNESPWNKYSSSAPAIVDHGGNFYGYLSANKYLGNRTQIKALNQLADLVAELSDLDKARELYCGD